MYYYAKQHEREKRSKRSRTRSERNNKTKHTITIPCDFPTYVSLLAKRRSRFLCLIIIIIVVVVAAVAVVVVAAAVACCIISQPQTKFPFERLFHSFDECNAMRCNARSTMLSHSGVLSMFFHPRQHNINRQWVLRRRYHRRRNVYYERMKTKTLRIECDSKSIANAITMVR